MSFLMCGRSCEEMPVKRAKPLFFFLAFFFVTLAPTANIAILIGTDMAERFLYLPSIGFLGALVWVGWMAYRRAPQTSATRFTAAGVLAVVTLALGARTFTRNFDWYDERSLWESAVRTSPNSYKAHESLAQALVQNRKTKDQPERSVAEIDKAIAILAPLSDRDKVPVPYAIAGQFYRVKGDNAGPPDSAVWYRKSIDVLLEGERADAERSHEFERLNRRQGRMISPNGWPPLYIELGKTYRAMGKFEDALDALTLGQQIDARAEFFDEISLTYQAMGEPGKAATALLQGVLMSPADQQRFAAEVLKLYQSTASQSCALEGNSVNFTCPMVREQLCAAAQNAALLDQRMFRIREAGEVVRNAVQGLGCPATLFR